MEAVLEAKVSDIHLLPNEVAIESEYDKQAVFDVVCTLNGTEAVNIEMQGVDADGSYDKRAEYHAAHILNHFSIKGTKWKKIPKVFQISVLNFIYDRSSPQAFSHYCMRTNDNRSLSDRMSIIFIELPKLVSENDDTGNLTAAEKWGKFLLYADNESKREYIKKLCSQEAGIMAAQETLIKLSQDDVIWAREMSRNKFIMDYNSGMDAAWERGLNQGRAEAQTEIAQLKARIAELEAEAAK